MRADPVRPRLTDMELATPLRVERARLPHLRHHLAYGPARLSASDDEVNRLEMLHATVRLVGDLAQQRADRGVQDGARRLKEARV